MKITIARDLVELIEFLGVDLAFGISGGFIVPIWQELTRSKKNKCYTLPHRGG